MNNQNNEIILNEWYQVDFRIANPDLLVEPGKVRKIFSIMEELKEKKLIDMWFFLREKSKLRIRWHSLKKEETKKEIETLSNNFNVEIIKEPNPSFKDDLEDYPPIAPFSDYSEKNEEAFPNSAAIETFADIMSRETNISIIVTGIVGNIELIKTTIHCLQVQVALLYNMIAKH